MFIDMWILATILGLLCGIIIRELMESRKLAKRYKMANIIIGYMQARFDYIPTLSDIDKGVGLTDMQIAAIVNEK